MGYSSSGSALRVRLSYRLQSFRINLTLGGLSTVPSGSIHWLLSMGCRGISALVAGAPSAPPFSLTLLSILLFLTFFFSLLLPIWCFAFKYVFLEVPPPWLMGLAVSCCRFFVPLPCLAWGSSGLSSQRQPLLCQHLDTSTQAL